MVHSTETAMMENQKGYHGSLIAFEGPENLVSTQLRLLPTSPQVLVLPGLEHYMKEDSDTRFDPRSYVKAVHQAALTRHEAALRFLNNSTSDNKRLVFLNGGTAAAVSQCISTISECQVSGDVIVAEAIYKNIAAGGARVLEQDAKHANQQALETLNNERDLDEALWEEHIEDPITKAMRAADALYKETEFLQPIDCYIRTRPRSLSLPMLDYANELGQVSPFFVFGSSPSEGTPSVFEEDDEGPSTAGGEEDTNRSRALKKLQGGQKLRFSTHRPVSNMGAAIRTRNVDGRSTMQFLPPTAGGFESPPITPEGVVYGEARVVQMQAAKSQDLRKIRSLDDMELIEARRRRISVQIPTQKEVSPIDSPGSKSRHLSIADDPYSPNNLRHLPVAKFVKAHKMTIRRSPTFLKTLPKPARDTYVHQGTDAADFGSDSADSEAEFEPVLPFHEDLVVHFTSFSTDYVLGSVVQSLKGGLYPILSTTSESFGTVETDSCPSTPRTADLFDLEVGKGDGLATVPEEPSADEGSDYDPYAAHGNDVRCGSKTAALRQPSPRSPNMRQPPTPTQIDALNGDAVFHNFSIQGYSNAIVTQNALRLMLEDYYPQKEGSGYLQYANSSILSDMNNNMWRPMFKDFEAQGSRSTQNTADMILAIGCQKGVKSEFVSAFTGQIEKFGSKSNGVSRSGCLDIRYLLATAMQSYNTQALASLTDGPLSDSPYSLACLLISHLETYLATNAATRFLILSYPPEHLPTVLALQKLMGADMFKIVGILDTSDPCAPTDMPSPSALSTGTGSSHSLTTIETSVEASNIPTPPPLSNMSETRSTLARRRRRSFSRADYVLTSSATEAEISALIITIWNVLVDIDAFYTPEPAAQLSSHGGRGRPVRGMPTLVSKFTSPASPPLSPRYRHDGPATPRTPRTLAGMDFPYPPPPLPPPSVRSDSPSRSSVRSGRSGRQQHIASAKDHSRRGDDAMSGDLVDVVDEGEFDDAEERRLMPMYMRQSEMRKGNSRKALKWLGLA